MICNIENRGLAAKQMQDAIKNTEYRRQRTEIVPSHVIASEACARPQSLPK